MRVMESVLAVDEQVMQSMEMIMVLLWVVERVEVVGVSVAVHSDMVLEELVVERVVAVREMVVEVLVEAVVPSLAEVVE